MEDRRKFFRFEAPLNVKYTSDNSKIKGQSRTTNVSREGVSFPLLDKVGMNEILKMQFDIPGDNFPVLAQGAIMWVDKGKRKKEKNFNVGVKLTSITRADRGRILEYAYQQWLKLKNMGRKE